MEAETGAGLVPSSTTRWRRIPWGVPVGRKPRFRQALPSALAIGLLFLAIGSGLSIASVGLSTALAILGAPIVAIYVIATSLALVYGVAVIATARKRSLTPSTTILAGLDANPAARRWYGLAYVIPPGLAWSFGLMFRPTMATEWRAELWLVAPLLVIACIVLARIASNREVKRAILGGRAPSYDLSPDLTWWRKGDTWASVTHRVWWDGQSWIWAAAEAPPDALRSPDGNYWWSGRSWCPMPPIPKRHKDGKVPAGVAF